MPIWSRVFEEGATRILGRERKEVSYAPSFLGYGMRATQSLSGTFLFLLLHSLEPRLAGLPNLEVTTEQISVSL